MIGYHKVVREEAEFIATRELPWDKLKNSTVLITGAAGFISAYLVYTIISRNDLFGDNIRILALVRNIEKARLRFEDILGRSDFELIVQDVSCPINGVYADFIVHAASPANMKAYSSDPVGTMSANVTGTMNILELALKCNSKGVLFLSSGMVYGNIGGMTPVSEFDFKPIDSMNKRNVYIEAKRAGEMLCAAYHAQYGLPVKVVRPFCIYGPGEQPETGRAVICFARDAYLGRDIVLKSCGRSVRSFCYVMDAAEAMFTVILKGEAGRAYNVGSDTDILSIQELAGKFTAAVKDRHLKVMLPEDTFYENIGDCFIPELTQLSLLGWKQHICIEQGILRMLKSFD